jgi:hypothetical protein
MAHINVMHSVLALKLGVTAIVRLMLGIPLHLCDLSATCAGHFLGSGHGQLGGAPCADHYLASGHGLSGRVARFPWLKISFRSIAELLSRLYSLDLLGESYLLWRGEDPMMLEHACGLMPMVCSA